VKRWLSVFIIAVFASAGIILAAPDAITDLAVIETGFRHLTLHWTAPYDTAAATDAAHYVIRASSAIPLVTDTDWNNNSSSTAYPYCIMFASAVPAGTPLVLTVTGLENGRTWFFAIRSSTDALTYSALDTSSPEPVAAPVNTAPGSVGGHNLMYGVIITSAAPILSWSTPSAGSTDDTYGDQIVSFSVELSLDTSFALKTTLDSIVTTWCQATTVTENTTWYWRVRAVDADGLNSTAYLLQADRRFIVNAINEPATAPAQQSPVDQTVVTTAEPLLAWQGSTDVDPGDSCTYTLRYSTSPSFEAAITTTVAGNSLTQYQITAPDALAENVRYWWQVSVVDDNALTVPSTGTWSFAVDTVNELPDAFATLAPSSGAVVATAAPVLVWEPARDPDPNDACTYSVFYSTTDALLFTVYTQIDGLGTTVYTLPDLPEDVTCWWKIRADDGSLNRETDTVSFRVNAVSGPPAAFHLLASSGMVAAAQPVLSWETAADADGDAVTYTVWYSTDSSFAVTTSSAGITGTTCTPAVPLTENATWYWKVRATDATAAFTDSTETWSMAINAVAEPPQAFTLTAPVNAAVVADLTPTFTWTVATDPDPGDRVVSYTLCYSSAADYSTQIVVPGLTVPTYTCSAELAAATTWYWNVTAVAAFSGTTVATGTGEFVTANAAPAAFNLVSPSGIIATATPTLDWQNAADPEGEAVTYTVAYSSVSSFAFAYTSAGLTASQYTLPALSENSTWYWRVDAVDIWNNTTRSAQTSTIFVNAVEEAPAAPTLSTPAAQAQVGTRRPTVTWAAAADPDPGSSVTYTVQYSTDPTLAGCSSVTGISATAYTIPVNLTAPATWYWRVTAIDNTARQTASELRLFVVLQSAVPSAPGTFSCVRSADAATCALSWSAVTTNADGSSLTDLAGYHIYRAYRFDDIFTSTPLASVAAGTAWTDPDVNAATVYYLVRAYTVWDVAGLPSTVQQVATEPATVYCADDYTASVVCPAAVFPASMTVLLTRQSSAETGAVIAAYTLAVPGYDGYRFAQPVTLRIDLAQVAATLQHAPGSETLTAVIYWHNGVAWVPLGGEKDGDAITVATARTGQYQVRSAVRTTQFATLATWPKIITPNNDGCNDEFNYTAENPGTAMIEGMIYDSAGGSVSRMEARTATWLVWDGTARDGAPCLPGVYLYQITCGDYRYTGTIVVAR
jgi:hypothetical protein